MINSVTITNFKGFEFLDIPRLSNVTLIGGQNNFGKSSLLEVLFMFHDRLNPQMITRQFGRRGVETITAAPETMFAPAFNNYNLENEIILTVTRKNSREKLRIKFNPSYQPDSSMIQTITASANMLPALDLTYSEANRKDQTAHLVIMNNQIVINFDQIKPERQIATMFGARQSALHTEDTQNFGQLDILGQTDKIVEFVKLIEPRLKSLSVIATGGISLIHGDIGLSRKIPVAYMGDGVARLLSIILAIATSKEGIVLIDEFENGIHHSVMPKIWDAITKAAREYNCQVIGTTHSYECLEAAYNGISNELSNDFSYVRIDRIEGKTIAKCFDYELLKVALTNNLEIR